MIVITFDQIGITVRVIYMLYLLFSPSCFVSLVHIIYAVVFGFENSTLNINLSGFGLFIAVCAQTLILQSWDVVSNVNKNRMR